MYEDKGKEQADKKKEIKISPYKIKLTVGLHSNQKQKKKTRGDKKR